MTWQDMIERFERLEGRVAALEKPAGGEAVAGGLKQTKEYASVSEMVHDLAGEEFATEFDESIAQPRYACGGNIEQEQSAATAKSLGQIVETARACNWDKTTLAEAVAAHIRSTEVAPLRDELANACAVNEELNRDIAGYSEMLAAERQRADAAESRCECLSKNLSSVNAKLRELENWKQEQMQVESEWDAQDIAKQLGGWPGQSCRKVISDKVPLLIANVKRLERERDAAIAEADEAKNEARRWYQQFKGL